MSNTRQNIETPVRKVQLIISQPRLSVALVHGKIYINNIPRRFIKLFLRANKAREDSISNPSAHALTSPGRAAGREVRSHLSLFQIYNLLEYYFPIPGAHLSPTAIN